MGLIARLGAPIRWMLARRPADAVARLAGMTNAEIEALLRDLSRI